MPILEGFSKPLRPSRYAERLTSSRRTRRLTRKELTTYRTEGIPRIVTLALIKVAVKATKAIEINALVRIARIRIVRIASTTVYYAFRPKNITIALKITSISSIVS